MRDSLGSGGGIVEGPAFFSSNILAQIAFDAAERSSQSSNENLVAILFSAAWVEGALNEIIYDLTSVGESDLNPLLHEAKRSVVAAKLFESKAASVDLKLRTLCAAVTQEQLIAGSQPWQRLSLLLDLQNWLLHSRPERLSIRQGTDQDPSIIVSDEVHNLVKSLKSAGAINEIPGGRLVSVATALGLPGVGRWSYRAAYDSLATVARWYPAWWRDILNMVREPTNA